jgi:uncharacterized protein (DUF342 family)
MKTSQHAWIAAQLTKRGKITRNQCLARYISRLAARISDLREAGWEIVGNTVKTKNGKDYVYTLVKNS